ncbi:metalloregulator ArsR/SmtB family transcription factor [Oleispirillum naphthae]|uniref:metalloregulator ArsR/SmtB family transcription factor n=1 Tax=Oleispirillum naphthae TaxID=2838853 RepID=UPI0030825C96
MIDALATAAKALADRNRLRILKMLEGGELCVCQIVAVLGLAPATVSKHLSLLRAAGLLLQRRDGRWAYYRLAPRGEGGFVPGLLALAAALPADDPVVAADRKRLAQVGGMDLAEACVQAFSSPRDKDTPMREAPYSVLFLCTGNSARSIMAEAILNAEGGGRFRAFSAGSHPKGALDPAVLKLLQAAGLPTAGLRSKSWDEFAVPGAPALDFVFTVCDDAAGEVCPIWPGQPVTAHWGLPDPAAFQGGETEKIAFCAEVMRMLRARIGLFCALPLASLDRLSLQRRLQDIGRERAAAEAAR